MIDMLIGLMELGIILIGCFLAYFAAQLVAEIKDARDYVRQQNEIYRDYDGEWRP